MFLIRDALETAQVDADIHVVSDGDSATRFLDAADADPCAPRPALVLLDMNLPGKGGGEVLKYLRASTRCHDAAVLIVSSSQMPRDHAAVANLAVCGYFTKPSAYADFPKLGPIVRGILQKQADPNE